VNVIEINVNGLTTMSAPRGPRLAQRGLARRPMSEATRSTDNVINDRRVHSLALTAAHASISTETDDATVQTDNKHRLLIDARVDGRQTMECWTR
jgi:hypothetical protein